MPKLPKKSAVKPTPPSDIHQLNLLLADEPDYHVDTLPSATDNPHHGGASAEGGASTVASTAMVALSSSSSSSFPSIFFSTRQDHGLISHKRQRLLDDSPTSPLASSWLRPYWLGCGLFLVLYPFWILDTLKDPVFGKLVDGNLELHQPSAKLFSVFLTLCLVCLLEYVSDANEDPFTAGIGDRRDDARRSDSDEDTRRIQIEKEEEVLDPGGKWLSMQLRTAPSHGIHGGRNAATVGGANRVPGSIFASIGIPYCIGFGIMAYLLQFNPAVAHMAPTPIVDDIIPFLLESAGSTMSASSSTPSSAATRNRVMWHVLGYFFFAGIESFGSIAVASFWSYVNSSLSLDDAEAFYGLIIGMAQLGAIAGSTTTMVYVWSNVTLLVLACLVIILHILVMTSYDRRFDPTSGESLGAYQARRSSPAVATPASAVVRQSTLRIHPPLHSDDDEDARPQPEPLAASSPTIWSGLYLVLKYNYVLLILGASCLYEVSLTCLNYQMTLLGWSRFQKTEHRRDEEEGMNFTRFMGRYGQMVNVSSLVLSSFIFPALLRRCGLRWTLRIFPSLLLAANLLAFGILPGNLSVLFVSLAVLKALTYSIHDPSKELLYLPTSNSIKFKSKFWIDVVGARFAKAVGSSINTISGSVDRSIRVASAPSLLTSAALWWVCYQVGERFDRLIATGSIVGMEDEDPSRYTALTGDEPANDDGENAVDFETDEALFDDPTTPTTALEALELTARRRST
jgi:AAA family ATP:ADP antiporter